MAKRDSKGRFVKPKSKKEQVLAKTKSRRRKTIAQLQKEQRYKKDKSPTRVINMHGSNYTLYDDKPRSKSDAQAVRQKLKAQGKSAFINPRKRKAGVQWFIYQKPSEHAKARARKPVQAKVSKRTGVPTKTINMHGKNYNLHDEKPRNKIDAGKLRKKLITQGFSAFLNPRKRKSGTEYFVYKKKAERRRKSTSKKKNNSKKTF